MATIVLLPVAGKYIENVPDPVIDDDVVPDTVAPPLSLRLTVHASVV